MNRTRENGKKALSLYFKIPKNISVIEEKIYKLSKNNHDTYKNCIMQTINDIKNKKTVKSIFNSLKNEDFGWKHENFENIKHKLQEQDDYIINPFEAEEGVIICSCGSNRTISFCKQTRSGDEATSVIVNCVKCKKSWTINN